MAMRSVRSTAVALASGVLVIAIAVPAIVARAASAAISAPGGARDARVVTASAGASCDPSWIPTFGPLIGMDGTVHALAVYDDGSGAGPMLYAGGEFTAAGGFSARNIARWDGTSWSALGSGVGGDDESAEVRALAVYDDGAGPALYAGGLFTSAGGVPAMCIARWDGSTWSAVGGGTGPEAQPDVLALAVHDDGKGAGPALYAAGRFVYAGGRFANRIARWDGASWSPLGDGIEGEVNALAAYDDGSGAGPVLYAGGLFATAGGLHAQNIARWDGTSWSALGTGANAQVHTLAVHDDGGGAGSALYAGGAFFFAGDTPSYRVARWDGSSWLGIGNLEVFTAAVRALASYDDGSGAGPALYAAGSTIARWNGSSWSPVGGATSTAVRAFAVHDDGTTGGPALFVGGLFGTIAGVQVRSVARWDGSSWTGLGEAGIAPNTNALTIHDDGSGAGPALHASGLRWDGSSWSGTSFGTIFAQALYDDGSGAGRELYAGGSFTSAAGVAANHIARWNGSSWSPLGTGIALGGPIDYVRALVGFDDGSGDPVLCAGGFFTSAGLVLASNIAFWNGSEWWAPAGLTAGDGAEVFALAVHDDGSGTGPDLYVGGYFTMAGLVPASSIARWDGSSWSALGSGIGAPGKVLALAEYDDGSGAGPALYAGGSFSSAGGVAASNIARWDGSSWSPLGSGAEGGEVRALAVHDDGRGQDPALYAGGNFTSAGGVDAGYIARWDGSTWSTLGAGVSNFVRAIVGNDGGPPGPGLYVAGAFIASPAGDSRIARWGCVASHDFDGDGVVGFADLTQVLLHWGACPDPCSAATCPWDIDSTCDVGFNDLVEVLLHWG